MDIWYEFMFVCILSFETEPVTKKTEIDVSCGQIIIQHFLTQSTLCQTLTSIEVNTLYLASTSELILQRLRRVLTLKMMDFGCPKTDRVPPTANRCTWDAQLIVTETGTYMW